MDDPWPREQCSARSDHSAADGLESPVLQVIPSVGFQSAQIVPIVYENVCKHKITAKCICLVKLLLKDIGIIVYLPSISLNRGSNSI